MRPIHEAERLRTDLSVMKSSTHPKNHLNVLLFTEDIKKYDEFKNGIKTKNRRLKFNMKTKKRPFYAFMRAKVTAAIFDLWSDKEISVDEHCICFARLNA